MVDATYLKVRVDHRICPMTLMIAMGMTRDGVKELIGFRLKACESRETWGGGSSPRCAPEGFRAQACSPPTPTRGSCSELQEVYCALAALSGALLAQRLRRGPQAAVGVPSLRARGDVQLRHA